MNQGLTCHISVAIQLINSIPDLVSFLLGLNSDKSPSKEIASILRSLNDVSGNHACINELTAFMGQESKKKHKIAQNHMQH